jgi:hypothetical protein
MRSIQVNKKCGGQVQIHGKYEPLQKGEEPDHKIETESR